MTVDIHFFISKWIFPPPKEGFHFFEARLSHHLYLLILPQRGRQLYGPNLPLGARGPAQ